MCNASHQTTAVATGGNCSISHRAACGLQPAGKLSKTLDCCATNGPLKLLSGLSIVSHRKHREFLESGAKLHAAVGSTAAFVLSSHPSFQDRVRSTRYPGARRGRTLCFHCSGAKTAPVPSRSGHFPSVGRPSRKKALSPALGGPRASRLQGLVPCTPSVRAFDTNCSGGFLEIASKIESPSLSRRVASVWGKCMYRTR